MDGIIYPQWAVGFPRPFEDKIGIEFKDDFIVAIHGKSRDADHLREYLIGGRLHELGCGFNPKAPRYQVYPAGANSPGALHFGCNAKKESAYLKRTIPNWEEPHIHMDFVSFDMTVKAGNTTLIDDGFLSALRDEQVVAAATRYGDPVELLESLRTNARFSWGMTPPHPASVRSRTARQPFTTLSPRHANACCARRGEREG